MKFAIFTLLLALFALSVSGVALPPKSVIVSFPNSTPDNVVTQAKNAILAAVSDITARSKVFNADFIPREE